MPSLITIQKCAITKNNTYYNEQSFLYYIEIELNIKLTALFVEVTFGYDWVPQKSSVFKRHCKIDSKHYVHNLLLFKVRETYPYKGRSVAIIV